MLSQNITWRWGVVAGVLLLLICPALSPSQNPKPAGPIPEFRSLAFSANGKFLAAGSGEPNEPGVVAVWDVAGRRRLLTHREKRGVPSVALSPNGKLLAVGAFEGECRLIDVASGKVQHLLPGHGKAARVVIFSPDGKTLATGSYDHMIRLWDLGTFKVKKTLEGHTNWVWSIAFSSNGRLLASGSVDNTVRLWDPAGGKLLKTWPTGFAIRHVAFVPHGTRLGSIGYDSAVRIFDSKSHMLLAKLGNAGQEDLGFTADGKTVAACGIGPDIKLFSVNMRQANETEIKRIHQLIVLLDDDDYGVRENASRELLDMGNIAEPFLYKAMKETKSAEVRIRSRRLRKSLRTAKPEAVLRGHQDQVLCMSISPDGKMLASSGKDGLIYLWDVASRQKIGKLTP